MRLRRFVAVTCSVALGACHAVYDVGALGRGEPDGENVIGDDAADGGERETSPAEASLADVESGPCARLDMVRAGDACIDRTEVTQGAYAKFTAAATTAGQPSACTWNATFVPQGTSWPPPKEKEDLPVYYVDWCDARAYCAWHNKRLCRGVGQRPLSSADATDPAKSEWLRACTRDGARVLPYGNTQVDGRCVVGRTIEHAGSATGCEGGYDGLLDMVGNVEEWIDACAGDLADDTCVAMGGSYLATDAECAQTFALARTDSRGTLGFRCCL